MTIDQSNRHLTLITTNLNLNELQGLLLAFVSIFSSVSTIEGAASFRLSRRLGHNHAGFAKFKSFELIKPPSTSTRFFSTRLNSSDTRTKTLKMVSAAASIAAFALYSKKNIVSLDNFDFDSETFSKCLQENAAQVIIDERFHYTTMSLNYSIWCGLEDEIIKGLIENGADINLRVDGYTAFEKAVWYERDIKTIKHFIENGADISTPSQALNIAISGGQFETGKYLIELGAYVNVEDIKSTVECRKRNFDSLFDPDWDWMASGLTEERYEEDLKIVCAQAELLALLLAREQKTKDNEVSE